MIAYPIGAALENISLNRTAVDIAGYGVGSLGAGVHFLS